MSQAQPQISQLGGQSCLPPSLQFDVCILGIGPGALVFAKMALVMGRRVVALADPVLDDHVVLPLEATKCQLEAMGATVLVGTPQFETPYRVRITDVVIEAGRVLVTRRVASDPQIKMPRAAVGTTQEVVVVGDVSPALHHASIRSTKGVKVTILTTEPDFGDEDPDVLEMFQMGLQAHNIQVQFQADVSHVRENLNSCKLPAQPCDEVELVVVSGSSLCLNDMGLAKVGIDLTCASRSAHFQTNNKGVFAIGEALGATPSAAVELYQAGIAARSALVGLPSKGRAEHVPRIYQAPMPMACYGLTEHQARGKWGKIAIYRASLGLDLQVARNEIPVGCIKVIARPSGRVIGVGIVGANAPVLLAPWQVAITKGLRITDLTGVGGDAVQQIVQQAVVVGLRSPLMALSLTILKLFRCR